MTTSGKPTEGKYAVLAEPIYELAGHTHEFRGLSRCDLILSTQDHDARPVGDGIEHRTHRNLDRSVAVQSLCEALGVRANGRVYRVECGGKWAHGHDFTLPPCAITATILSSGVSLLGGSHSPMVEDLTKMTMRGITQR